MEKITYICDMKDVKNVSDLVYRLRDTLQIFNAISREKYPENIRANAACSWDALIDDLSWIPVKTKYPEIKEVELVVVHFLDIEKNVSKEVEHNLLIALAYQTDPAQRIDGLKFIFQIRLGAYEPEKEELHVRLHRGLPNGKDMNN